MANGFTKEQAMARSYTKPIVRSRLDGLVERQKEREAARAKRREEIRSRMATEKEYPVKRGRPRDGKLPPDTGRCPPMTEQEHRMVRQALAMQERIVNEERLRTYGRQLFPSERSKIA